ncbi:MAG: hypothetical protein IID18_05510 [Nitrospinae bacterium]|nr:hypothetical protein [Nitrospinota bacterium]
MKAVIFQNAMADAKIKTAVLVFGGLFLVVASYTIGARSSASLDQTNNMSPMQSQVVAATKQDAGQNQAPQLLSCQYGECKPIS